MHAIDRVGEGPWYDRRGRLIAMNKAGLVGSGNRPAGDAAAVNDLPDETGQGTKRLGDTHDAITGSNPMGMLRQHRMLAQHLPGLDQHHRRAARIAGPRLAGGQWHALDRQAHTEPSCAAGVNLVQNGAGQRLQHRRRRRLGRFLLLRSAALSFALALAPGLALSAPVPTAPKTRPAAARPTTRDAVEKLLRATERPPGPADLNTAGAGAEDALIAIAGDKAAEAVLRARATSAMAHAASPRARAFLLEVVTRGATQDPATATVTDRLVLRRAAVALGWQSGPGAPAPLGALLAHPDPDVRTDAAVGLGLTRLAPAANLLRNHLALEKDARVRGHDRPPAANHRDQLGPGPVAASARAARSRSSTSDGRSGHRSAPRRHPPARARPAAAHTDAAKSFPVLAVGVLPGVLSTRNTVRAPPRRPDRRVNVRPFSAKGGRSR